MFESPCENIDCHTDLHLDAYPEFSNVSGRLIVGSSDLQVTVTVDQTGDPSFGTMFHLTFPRSLLYMRFNQIYGDPIDCVLRVEGEESGVSGTILAINDTTNAKNATASSVLKCACGNPMNATGFEVKVGHRFFSQVRLRPRITFYSMLSSCRPKTVLFFG